MGHLVRLRHVVSFCRNVHTRNAEQWTAAQKETADGMVRDLAARIARMGPPDRHPWRGVERADLIASDRTHVAEDVAATRSFQWTCVDIASALARALSQPAPATLA